MSNLRSVSLRSSAAPPSASAYRPLSLSQAEPSSALHRSRFFAPFGARGSRTQRLFKTLASGKENGGVVSCAFVSTRPPVRHTAQVATRGGVKKLKGQNKRAAEAARTVRAAVTTARGGEDPDEKSLARAEISRMCLLAAGTRVHFLDLEKGEVTAHYSAIKDYVRCVSCRSDGKLFSVGDDGGLVQVVQTDTRDLLRRFKGHTGSVRSCCFSVDKTRVLSTGDDTTIRLWELSGGECLQVLKGHGDSVRSVDVPRGPALPSGAGGGVMTRDADTEAALLGHPFDNACLTGSYDCTARLWDLRSPQNSALLFEHDKPVEFVRFVNCVPHASMLLSCVGPVVKLWDARRPSIPVCSVASHVKTVTAAHAIPGPVAAAAAPRQCARARAGRRRSTSDLSDGTQESQDGETQDEKEDDEEEEEEDDEEDEELIREREELRQGLVVATASLDATVKLTSLSSLQVRHTFVFDSEVLALDFSLAPSHTLRHQMPVWTAKESHAATFFVGMADGCWSLRQRSNAGGDEATSFAQTWGGGDMRIVPSFQGARKRRKLLMKMRAHQAHYFTRGRTALPLPADIVVDTVQAKRLNRLDRLLRSFQYQAALDVSLTMSTQHVVALVAELLQRGGLEVAMRGRDSASLLPLLRFISKNIAFKNGTYTRLVSEMTLALLHECEDWIVFQGNDKEVMELLKRICQKIAFELNQIQQMDRLHSLLDALLAS